MERVRIGFSRPNKWKPFSALIMAGYGTPFSHVYIRFHSGKYKRDLIYQASSTMVNFMGPEVFEAHNVVVREFDIEIPEDRMTALMQFMIDNAGKAYSMKQVAGLFWVRLNELLGRKIQNPFPCESREFVCSVLGDEIVDRFSLIPSPEDSYDMSPRDLWDWLEKNTQPNDSTNNPTTAP